MGSEEKSTSGLGAKRRGLVRWFFGGIFVLVLVGFFVVPFFLFGGLMRGFYGSGPSYSGPFFFFPFGFFVLILIGLFAARLIFWGRGWRRGYYSRGWGYGGEAEEILKSRYARGETTKEQFELMKKDLE